MLARLGRRESFDISPAFIWRFVSPPYNLESVVEGPAILLQASPIQRPLRPLTTSPYLRRDKLRPKNYMNVTALR